MVNYSFVKCLNPRHITNIYTGDTILAECGKCECCLLKKSLARTTRCKLESAVHRFTFFITLTFDNDNLPTFRLVKIDPKSEIEDYNCVAPDGELLGVAHFDKHSDKMMLIKKCKTPLNTLPWLNPCICQLFIKRLRKYLSKYTNEKIRTFYCGELGPVHFRPHFHLLLWFDSDEIFEVIQQAVSACWSFGRVDCQISSGKSAAYVSSYLNSNMYLPTVFKFRRTSPFSHHSFYLGESIFQDLAEKVQNNEFESIRDTRFFGNGINTECVLWRSLKARLLPRCKGYNEKSVSMRIFTYKLNEVIANWTGEARPKQQARFIVDYIRLFDTYCEIPEISDILQYFVKNSGSYQPSSDGTLRYIVPFITDWDKFERSVYIELLLSRRFIRDFCHGNSSLVPQTLKNIDLFYKYLDYENLKQQLKMEYELSKTTDKENVRFFFHNKFIVDDLKELPTFKRFSSSKKLLFADMMKHKELNDKNLIFNYI